ncbi:MAG: c-type cytochrome [Bilophila wadsworthia]
MRGFMKYACVLALPLLVAAGAAQAQTWPDGGNPSEGATLYDSCVPCHTLNGNGLAGKSVSDLMDKMKAYQSGTFTDAKLLGMQQVLKPLSTSSFWICGLYQQDVIRKVPPPCS